MATWHPAPTLTPRRLTKNGLGLSRNLGLALCVVLAAGCASAPPSASSAPSANAQDPWEPLNRKIFAFNEGLDQAVTKPVAQAYVKVTPYPVRLPISNFFNNLQDGWSTVNLALQLRPQPFLQSLFRFTFNTFWGFGGLINLADDMGLERNPQDFGKTLGRWGVGAGPYMVLPILGASTLRDTAGVPVDLHYSLLQHEVKHIPSRNSLYALQLVDKRASLLAAGQILDEAALDKYAFMRNAYLQKRHSEINTLRGVQDDEAEDDDAAFSAAGTQRALAPALQEVPRYGWERVPTQHLWNASSR